jgi:hypothetical protein
MPRLRCKRAGGQAGRNRHAGHAGVSEAVSELNGESLEGDVTGNEGCGLIGLAKKGANVVAQRSRMIQSQRESSGRKREIEENMEICNGCYNTLPESSD